MASSSTSSLASSSPTSSSEKALYCYCGLKAPRWTSWSNANPGRRFNSCPNYKNPDARCTFFVWYDGQMPERATEVMIEQRDMLKALRSDNFQLKRENLELKNVKLETEHCDDVWALRCEINALNCELKVAAEEAKKEQKWKIAYQIVLLLTWTMLVVVVLS